MQMLFDTKNVLQRDRFSYWQDAACDAYLPIACEAPDPSSFNGSISLERLSRLNLSFIKASAQTVSRNKSQISRDSERFFMVSVPLGESCNVTQSHRQAFLEPGDFALYSTAEPYSVEFINKVDQLVIQLPYKDLITRLPNVEMLTARRVDGNSALVRMAHAHLCQYASMIGTQTDEVKHLLQDTILDLLAASLATLTPAQHQLSRPQSMMLLRTKAYVRENLREHELNPTQIAVAMGVSRRSLRRLFADSNESLSAYIRDARLDKIAEELRNPLMTNMSISQVSIKWGMGNFQHFTRLFKARFGMTPSAYRQGS